MKILDENLSIYTHNSGLKICHYYDCDSSEYYANLTVNYGSNDFEYIKNEQHIVTPKGIAHFLEHVMFNSPKGDYFDQFSENLASANAYTSYNQTSYLFSCASNFEKNLNILIEMVTTLNIDDKKVDKERSIIAEELKMYSQLADEKMRTFHLENICESTNYCYDIGGTLKTIEDIDVDNLTKVFNDFYHVKNLTLFIYGNIEKEKLLSILDKKQFPANKDGGEKIKKYEKLVHNKNIEKFDSSIDTPISNVAIKLEVDDNPLNFIYLKSLLYAKFTEINPEYIKCLSNNTINESLGFYVEFNHGITYLNFSMLTAANLDSTIENLLYAEIEDVQLLRGYKMLLANELRKMNNSKSFMEGIAYQFNGVFDLFSYYELLNQEKTIEYILSKDIKNIPKMTIFSKLLPK